MTPFLQFTIALVILILAAKAGGYLSYRLGQPSVLGELIVGIVLGPSVIDVMHLPYFTDEHLAETIKHLAELGVLLLMFIAGLDLHISDFVRSGRVALFSGVLGVVLPVLLGFATGMVFALDTQTSLFIGLVLSATSVSISAQTLMELGVLRSRVGIGLLGAAVLDDVLVVLGLSIFIAILKSEGQMGLWPVLLIVIRMALYLAIASLVGLRLFPRLSELVHRLPVSQGLIAFTFAGALTYAWAAEALGSMAAITGAFLAGLFLSRSQVRERIERGFSVLAYGVFVPVFFVNVGLSANARELTGSTIWLFLVMVIVAILGKVLGSGVGALFAGFNRREALQMGVGMMSRGEVGLIVASVGIVEGLITQEIFSAIVGVVIMTTLLTPPWLRALSARSQPTSPNSMGERTGDDK